MLFNDKLEEKRKIIRPEIDRLLEMAWTNQAHPGDLLLLHINGFFQKDYLEWNINHPDNKFNPHVIGSGTEGQSEKAHYSFIHKYRTSFIHPMNHSEYVKQFVMEHWDEEIQKNNNKLVDIEETSIQLEMLIYLKFWESDLIIKKLYQFTRLLNGDNYDWYFKLSFNANDKTSTGTRQSVIKTEIQDKIKPHSETIYKILNDTYKTQIRNSIAHSNYSFLDRYIHPNNENAKKTTDIKSLSFDHWIDMFHNTITLHNEYIRINNLINEYYAKIAIDNDNSIDILITEKDGKRYTAQVMYRPTWKDWKFK